MKRWIHAAEDIDIQSGFFFTFKDKGIFLADNGQYLTDKIIRKFINAVCDIRSVGDKIRESALYDKATLADFRRRIDKAELEKKSWGYIIKGKNFSASYPQEDFEKDIIIL